MLIILTCFSSDIENYFYKNDLTKIVEYVGSIITVNYYYQNIYISSYKILSSSEFNDYFNELLKDEFSNMTTEGIRKQISLKEGIIPEISFTFALPNTFKYFVGEGGKVTVTGFQYVSFEYSQVVREGVIGEGRSYSQIKPDQQLQIIINGNVGDKIHITVDHDSKRPDETDNKTKIWYESKDEDDILQYLSLGDMKDKGDFGIYSKGTFANTKFDFSLKRETSEEVSKSVEKSASTDSIVIFDEQYAKDRFYFIPFGENDSLISIKVFYQNTDILSSVPAKYFKLNSSEKNVSRFKEQLPNEDYILNYFVKPDGKVVPFLELKNYPSGMIGICAIKKNLITGIIDTIGHYSKSWEDTTEILLIREFDPTPTDTTWYLMMRNIYQFYGGSDVQTIDVDIFKVRPGQEPTKIDEKTNKTYLELLGLDRNGDSKIDYSFYNTYKGIIFIPEMLPFLSSALAPDTVPAIYRKKQVAIDEKNKYFIQIKIKRSINEIQLESDIVENTDILIIGNDTLKRNDDYTIDYTFGKVTLLHPERYTPDEKIRIFYKLKPIIGSEKYNANLTLNTNIFNSNLKTTFNYNSIPSKEFYTRLGEEPSNLFLSGLSFNNTMVLDFLKPITSRMIVIGGVQEPKMSFSVDFKLSRPNPSSKGKGYVDNMERTEKTQGFGNSRIDWHPMSIPDGKDFNDAWKIYWWNIPINIKEIQPNRPESDIDYALQILFIPKNNDTHSFSGIMRSFGNSSIDISREQAIEMWVKGNEGILHIDIGTEIPEDIYRINRNGDVMLPNNKLDTEDSNGNKVLEDGEDTGLDLVQFEDTKSDAISSGDDGNDDYIITNPNVLSDSLRLNGTEGNNRIDTEDLFPDNSLELRKNYFSFEVDLSTNEYVVLDNGNGWRKIRIPLEEKNYSVVGSPSLQDIKYVRVWIDGVQDTTRIKIYNWNIIGNTWNNEGVFARDSSTIEEYERLTISYVSEYEDLNYISPVPRERITTGGYVEEKSILFSIDSLKKNHFVVAKQTFNTSKDFRFYKELKYFSFLKETDLESIRIFIRIGTDSLNYYEVRKILKKGDWDSISIDLDLLTSFKLKENIDSNFIIFGNPTLKSVYYISLGVENVCEESFSGIVYFDDIYLASPRKSMDTQYSYNINLDLTNNLSINYKEERRGLNFKESTGDLKSFNDASTISRSFGLKASLDKMFFDVLNLPLNYNLNLTNNTPYYYLNSDILLPDSLKERESSNSKSYNFSLSINSNKKIKSFIRYFIDPFSFNGSYRINESYSPYRFIDTTKTVNTQGSYNLTLPNFSLFKISLLPTNISLGTSFSKTEPVKYNFNTTDSVYIKQTVRPVNAIQSNFSTGYRPHSIIYIDYNNSFSIDRNYINTIYPYGWPVNFKENLNANLNIFDFIFRYSVSYNEDHSYEHSTSLGDTCNLRSGGIRRGFSVGSILKTGFVSKIPVFNKIISNFDNITTKFSIDRTASYYYLKGRPDFRFRYGFDTDVQKDLVFLEDLRDGGEQTMSSEISTRFKLLGINMNISGDFSLRTPYSRNDFVKKYTYNLPVISFDGIIPKGFILFNNFFNSINYNIRYSRKEDIQKRINEPDYLLNTLTKNITPEIRLGLKNQLTFIVRGSINSIISKEKSNINNLINEDMNWSFSVKTDYTFTQNKPFNLPFRKTPIKLKGNLSLSFENSVTGRKNIVRNLNTSGKQVNSDYYDINFKIDGRYSFTASIDGGLSLFYTKHNNNLLRTDRRYEIGGGMNVKFKF